MDNYIPLSIVRPKLDRVPPIRIKSAVWKPCNLSPKIKPAMQESKESHNKKTNRGKHKTNNSKDKSIKIQLLL